MATPTTPDEWLPVLTKRLDEGRTRIDLLRSYTNGDAPLPEAGSNLRAAWSAFQKKARTNLGELIIEAVAERIICNQITVGAVQNADNDEARKIWTENRMSTALADTVRDMLTLGVGYMVVGRSPHGRPVVSSEKPEFMYAATDPLRPWVARAAVKVWRDIDAGMDYAYVWVTGSRQRYERAMYDWPDRKNRKLLTKNFSSSWSPSGEAESFAGEPPVVVFQNHSDTGEFEPHVDIIDRINKDTLDRLVTVAMQAFRQRYLEGGLPKEDESGKAIDYASIFTPAPGALWDLPDGVTLKETQESAQSILAMLSAEKDDFRNLAAVTRTPLAMLVPEGQNQSAAGSEFAKEGLITKSKDRIDRIKPAGAEVIARALKIVNVDFSDPVELGFADPTFVTFAEKHDANVKAKSGDVPWRTRMIDILGYSADKVDAMQTELEEERLAAAAFAPEPPAAPVAEVAADAVAA